MKKRVLFFLVFSMFFLVWCEKNVVEQGKESISIQKWKSDEYIILKELYVDYPSIECPELMKLWKNKIYNYSICIPVEWAGIWPHTWYLTSLYDEAETIWIDINNSLSILYTYSRNYEKWKNDIKSIFWNKEVIEHYFINNDWNKESGDFNYVLKIWKNKYYRFSFDKKTDEMKAIINSIKVLEEF
jgi:hypothetical protein